MNALQVISQLKNTSGDVETIDLDISPCLSKDEQLMMTVMLVSLGFNVHISQTEKYSTIVKGERP